MNQTYAIIYNQLDTFNNQFIHKDTMCDILNKFEPKERNTKNILRNLQNQNKIKYLFNNYFYILTSDEQIKKYYKYSAKEMVFVVLNKLKIKWHLGLYSALQINNIDHKNDLYHQIPKTTIIINSKFSKTIMVLKQSFIFKKQQHIEVHIEKAKTNNRITFYYSDLERTHIEYIYYNKASPIDKDILNTNKINKYLNIFQKKYTINISGL